MKVWKILLDLFAVDSQIHYFDHGYDFSTGFFHPWNPTFILYYGVKLISLRRWFFTAG